MSEIKVNKISPATGTETTLGDASDDFLLPSGAEIIAQSGSTITIASGATLANAGTATGFGGGGKVKQMVYANFQTATTGSGNMPYDNTIPQITEGREIMTLAITPTSASSLLKIEVILQGSISNHAQYQIALFQDSTADALAVARVRGDAQVAVHLENNSLMFVMVAGTTSATTFRTRMGALSGTSYFNSAVDATSAFGGKCNSAMVITEIETGI